LANPLTGHVEPFADLFEHQFIPAIETEAELDDFGFPFFQRIDHVVEIGILVAITQALVRADGVIVAHDFTEGARVAVLADGGI